jgi:hypothetical protein
MLYLPAPARDGGFVYSFSAIGDRIDQLLHSRPEGLDAASVVSELSRQGLRGDDVAVALIEGVNYRKYDMDAKFRVTATRAGVATGSPVRP